MRYAMTLLVSLTLGACDYTEPVTGVADNGEVFTGTATGKGALAGNLELISDRGLRCYGSYNMASTIMKVLGETTVRPSYATVGCNREKTGSFTMVPSFKPQPTSAKGVGQIGDRQVTITMEKVPGVRFMLP